MRVCWRGGWGWGYLGGGWFGIGTHRFDERHVYPVHLALHITIWLGCELSPRNKKAVVLLCCWRSHSLLWFHIRYLHRKEPVFNSFTASEPTSHSCLVGLVFIFYLKPCLIAYESRVTLKGYTLVKRLYDGGFLSLRGKENAWKGNLLNTSDKK